MLVKQGLLASDSELPEWCADTIGSDFSTTIKPKQLVVTLMDAEAKPLMSLSFINAWLFKWAMTDLKSQNNQVVVESIEFAYSYF